MSIQPPPAADSSAIRSTCESAWTRASWSRVARGASCRSKPNQSWRAISASSPAIRSGRSGWPGMSWARAASLRNQGGGTPVPYSSVPGPASSDLVVVGAGAAGLFASLVAAREGARVTLVSARPLAETASYWAQGGLAAALAVDDSPALHLQDTVTAGRGLVRRSAAEVLCQEAPARFADLEALGVRFDADRHGDLALGLEGGHGVRRVVHAGGSATGRRILRQLSADVAEHPAIDVLEGARAAALATADRP